MRKASITAIVAFLLLVGSVGSALAQALTVKTAQASDGTTYLTDSNGMTLYYFTKDVSGQSVCTGGCAAAWPAFYAANVTVPSSLKASDFGTITRADGTKQTTFDGWPLYYFAKDKSPGDMTGQGFRNVWFIIPVPTYTVMLATSPSLGNYLTDANGMTLYYFTKDSPNNSVCSGKCISAWPAFYSSSIVVPKGIKASDFGTITMKDGTPQSTYKGYPLYYWIRDKARGDTTGQDIAKVWFVINPAKFKP